MGTPPLTPTRRSTLATGLVVLAALLIPISSAWPAAHSAKSPVAPGADKRYGSNGEIDVNSCATPAVAGRVGCFARSRIDAKAKALTPARERGLHAHQGKPAAAPAAFVGNDGAYSPLYLRSAYNAPSANAGATVAIVDAYDDDRAESDLAYYRSYFGLSPCTTENGCFRKVDQRGGTSYPQGSQTWGFEISLDVDMVSAICPNCHILLVEADSNSFSDMGAAVNTAVALGARVVSMSWGGMEYAGEVTDNELYFNHPGVAMVASSGDGGYNVEFPAASNHVIAVGGTTLYQATAVGTRDATETAWLKAGSGCSAYMAKPSWQHDTGCSKRTVADVSAIADPKTGVWVWDTYPMGGGWGIFGGTSVSAPIVAALYALAGNPSDSSTQMPSTLYGDPADLNDITAGYNGTCTVLYFCTAGPGYDGPTGLGTPNSITPFLLSSAPPQVSVPAPTSLTATFGHSIDLSWTAPPGIAVSRYLVERDGIQIATTTNTYYYDDAVVPGTTYSYDVRTVDLAGNVSGPSNVATASEPATPNAPSVTLSAGNRTVSIAWTPPASGATITGYRIYRGTKTGGETLLKSLGLVTSYADTRLTNGATYYYEVSAVTSSGEGPRSGELAATPAGVPSAPSVGTPANGPAGIGLTWSAPQNGGSPITAYNIYRGTASHGEILLATVENATTYTDTVVTGGTKYYYEVSAVNAIGTSPLSSEKSVVRIVPAAPSAPRNLTAATAHTVGVTLKWSTPASNGGANVTGYRIYRATASGSETLLATVGNVTSFTDTGTVPGTVYYYIVTAINPVGEGPHSNEASAAAH